MKEVTLNNKTFSIVETIGELPAKRGMAIYTAMNEYKAEKIDVNEFNFLYLSCVLGVPKETLEECKLNEFMDLLKHVNENFGFELNPSANPEQNTETNDETEKPE